MGTGKNNERHHCHSNTHRTQRIQPSIGRYGTVQLHCTRAMLLYCTVPEVVTNSQHSHWSPQVMRVFFFLCFLCQRLISQAIPWSMESINFRLYYFLGIFFFFLFLPSILASYQWQSSRVESSRAVRWLEISKTGWENACSFCLFVCLFDADGSALSIWYAICMKIDCVLRVCGINNISCLLLTHSERNIFCRNISI